MFPGLSSIITVIVFATIFLILKNNIKPSQKAEKGYQFEKKDKLLTNAERSFLGILDEAIPNTYRIFSMVRIADIIDVKGEKRQSGFNKIKAKHFDFVICKRDDLSIIGAIELNDKSHNEKIRVKRDVDVKNTCKEANLPVVFIDVKFNYSIEEIKSLVNKILLLASKK